MSTEEYGRSRLIPVWSLRTLGREEPEFDRSEEEEDFPD